MNETREIQFTLNGADTTVTVDPQMPLLWVLRDVLQLTGTRFGCGMALCGACTVHVNDQPVRSCVTPALVLAGQRVTTIEGMQSELARAVQDAWVAHDVPQCGYCQSGQVMSACALLAVNPAPTDAEIDAAMQGNVCRCGTYPRIRAAIRSVADGAVRADGNSTAERN